MGSYFSTLHIKASFLSTEDVKTRVVEHFKGKGCFPSDGGDCDFAVEFYAHEGAEWLSVYCDGFEYTDVMALAPIISSAVGADVLAISCFDSDYMLLNLVNAEKGYDHWLNIGESYEVKKPRRSNIAPWKNSVKNFDSFKSAAKEKYICAEDFLAAVEDGLGIPVVQSCGYEAENCTEKLYFKALKEGTAVPTKLKLTSFGLNPCKPEKPKACWVNNYGDASRGIIVGFSGSYIENDEITFEDTALLTKDSHGRIIRTPIVFEKRQNYNGDWVLIWEDKGFRIPAAVPDGLPPRVKSDKEFQRSFGVVFTPKGNARKFLDICIVLLPMSNKENGGTHWRVWDRYSSKREYIEWSNRNDLELKRMYDAPVELLDPDAYDLD